jgi:DNA-binding NarL/FixJ family response regulator
MVVDDQPLFRDGVREGLAAAGIDVSAEAATAADAVAVAADVKPDVTLCSLDLPDASGVQVIQRIRSASPLTRVVAVANSAEREEIAEALRAGARGCLLREAGVDEIVAGVQAAAAGHALLAPEVAAHLLEWIRETSPAVDLPDHIAPQLTERELEVLSLVAAGRHNGEIAEALVISEQTVKNHVSSILAKLEVENRIQAAVYAVRRQLV